MDPRRLLLVLLTTLLIATAPRAQAEWIPLKRAVQLDPKERAPWLELAQIYRGLGRTKETTTRWPNPARPRGHRD